MDFTPHTHADVDRMLGALGFRPPPHLLPHPPRPRATLHAVGNAREIEIVEHPLLDGRTVWAADAAPPPAAVVFSQPNYLGIVEDYAGPVGLAHEAGALAVA